MRCLKCDNMTAPLLCGTVVQCVPGEVCYIDRTDFAGGIAIYNSGCIPDAACQLFSNASTVFGRGYLKKNVCCCYNDFCNINGCGGADMPRDKRGPHCGTCYNHTDPTQCTSVKSCSQGEECMLREHRARDQTLYEQGCMKAEYCSYHSVSADGQCEPTCSEKDFSNLYCRPKGMELKQECIKNINFGYFYDGFTDVCSLVVRQPAGQSLSQPEAQRICAEHGADLMTIKNEDDMYFLFSWIFSHQLNDTDFWIGAYANVSRSYEYQWPDGSHVKYNLWEGFMVGQPTDRVTKNENCVFLNNKNQYYWHDTSCNRSLSGYICELWNVSNPRELEQACHAISIFGYFYDKLTHMCLRLHYSRTYSEHYTHEQAKAFCAQHGASLAIVDSDDRTDLVLRCIFINKSNATDYWIGAEDFNDTSDFFWPNKKALIYTHWGGPDIPEHVRTQPDSQYGLNIETCVYMDYHNEYHWFDEDCDQTKTGYICQYVGHTAVDTERQCHLRSTHAYFYDDYSDLCISIRSSVAVTRQEARNKCIAENADLVVVDSSLKTDFILTWIFFNQVNGSDYWIGGKDLYANATFYWEPSGHRFNYTNWYQAEPAEDCVYLNFRNNYKWDIENCNTRKTGYICQINKYTLGKQKRKRSLDKVSAQ